MGLLNQECPDWKKSTVWLQKPALLPFWSVNNSPTQDQSRVVFFGKAPACRPDKGSCCRPAGAAFAKKEKNTKGATLFQRLGPGLQQSRWFRRGHQVSHDQLFHDYHGNNNFNWWEFWISTLSSFCSTARSHPFHPGSRPVTELCTLSASWERSSLVFSGSIFQSFAFRCGRRVSRMGNCTSKDKERGGSRQMLKKSPPEGNKNHEHSMPWLYHFRWSSVKSAMWLSLLVWQMFQLFVHRCRQSRDGKQSQQWL